MFKNIDGEEMALRKTTLILIAAIISCTGAAKEPDWSSYRSVLTHLRQGNKNGVHLMMVDYAAINNNGNLEQAYQVLSKFDPNNLSNREEKLAFYINAYNILALKMVVDHWPVKSIKDIGNIFNPVWNMRAGELGNKTVSLDEIEHEILRPMHEPRIHMAIVCASVSCPDLRAEPYTASRLSEQLDAQAGVFLDNSNKGLKIENEVIMVSKIFDWFEEDFMPLGGVRSFIKRYKPDLPDVKIKAKLAYDWSING